MAGPTIITWGTPEQKERYLAKILSAEHIWCQGFSEPDAGSDLAAARTRIEDKGDHFLVNGQKVWSSFAHIADFCILVGLGDPEAPRYKNLSYVIVDMHAPGVEVRPLVQITGHPEFNEIFFTDVKVPKENILGTVGDGWQVAMTTLLHERGTLGFALSATLDVAVRKLIALAKERERDRPGPARPHRTRVDRAPSVEVHELPLAHRPHEDRHPRPRRLGIEACLVGEQPAPHEAGARDPRVARTADERGRDLRRVLAVPAAPLARQHDRSRHERDPPQHRRRARARSAKKQVKERRQHMDFSFTAEQDDLRREARTFLEANPSPSMEQLSELGWVGILQGDDFTFLDAAVLFEELGRTLYDGPFVLNEVAGQPGDDVWSIEIDGFVPHLGQVSRVLTPSMHAERAEGETLATVDETLGLGRLSPNGAEAAQGEWTDVRRRLLAALALEAVGIGSKASELALAYVSEREQFGKKIGSYQAISHSLVDGYVAVELARSLAYWAAWCVAENDRSGRSCRRRGEVAGR